MKISDENGYRIFQYENYRYDPSPLVLAAVAYIFVLLAYLESKKRFWIYVGGSTAGDSAVARAVNRLLSVLPHRI